MLTLDFPSEESPEIFVLRDGHKASNNLSGVVSAMAPERFVMKM